MAKERISSNVPRQTKRRVKEAADALNISESKFIEQAVETDLNKFDIREETKVARNQRDHFKSQFEKAQEELTTAGAKIEALYKRGLLARIFNLSPKL